MCLYSAQNATTFKTDSKKNSYSDRKRDKKGTAVTTIICENKSLLTNNLVFLDEFGLNLSLTRLFARYRKGEKAYGERQSRRGKNISIIGVISLDFLFTTKYWVLLIQ